MTHPVSIEGTIKLSDGTTTGFLLARDVGYTQWGNSLDNLWLTVDLLTALAETSAEYVRDEDDEEDE